jgi:hypothetical protein
VFTNFVGILCILDKCDGGRGMGNSAYTGTARYAATRRLKRTGSSTVTSSSRTALQVLIHSLLAIYTTSNTAPSHATFLIKSFLTGIGSFFLQSINILKLMVNSLRKVIC